MEHLLIGTVAIEKDLTSITVNAHSMNLLAQRLKEESFEIIYIGLFGVSISADISLYNTVFNITLNPDSYKATSHYIEFSDGILAHEPLGLHFSGDVDYLNTIDEMEDIE